MESSETREQWQRKECLIKFMYIDTHTQRRREKKKKLDCIFSPPYIESRTRIFEFYDTSTVSFLSFVIIFFTYHKRYGERSMIRNR